MLKLHFFGHLLWRANSLEKTLILGKVEGRRRRGRQCMRLLDDITNSMNVSLSKPRKIVEDRRAWHATTHGISKSPKWLSNWTTIMVFIYRYRYLKSEENVWKSCIYIWQRTSTQTLWKSLINNKNQISKIYTRDWIDTLTKNIFK